MALDNSAVLKVGTGAFYTASVGTAKPDDLLNPGPSWAHMGHTSLDDILSSASEGGEQTTLGSLQNPQLRTTTAARTESYTVNLLQFDTTSLKLYYGANAVVNGDGSVDIPQSPVATEAAWLFVFRDGERVGGIYAKKVSILRADDFAITDTESLSRLSLRVTPLGTDGSSSALQFIPPKPYTPGTPPAWEAETFYGNGARITVGAGVLEVEEDGTSGLTIPSLPGTVNSKVTDGTVRWTRIS